MRIEKLNENQIRCTLDREDLATRGLRLSELAYGTDKAKELFRDMMQQASYEFGFDAEDLPLMIEAIPASLDHLILIITKVEDPDELDTRFSHFSPDNSLEEGEEYFEDEDDMMNIIPFGGSTADDMSFTTTSEADAEPPEGDFIPLPDCLGVSTSSEENTKTAQQPKTTPDKMKVYAFRTLSDISQAAVHLVRFYHGENRVYKDNRNGLFYLVVFCSDHTTEEFGRVCNLLSEYAPAERSMYASLAHLDEHFEPILPKEAVQILATL